MSIVAPFFFLCLVQFSATESIESALFLATGQQVVLSPQNVLECTPNPQHCGGTGGCEGAIAELAFQWAETGIAAITTVPYLGTDAPCDPTVAKAAKTGGFVKLPENDPNALLSAIATVGPVSISVDASSWSFYGGGVYNGCDATKPDIDHAVQAVGYGTDAAAGQDYWLVRNSWGSSWGEQVRRECVEALFLCLYFICISIFPQFPHGASRSLADPHSTDLMHSPRAGLHSPVPRPERDVRH